MSTALKDTRESLTHVFDFSQVLVDELIVTPTVTTTDLTEISVSNTDTDVTVIVNGGTANVTGVVDVSVSTSLSNTYVQTLFVTVLDGSLLTTSEIDIVRLWIGDTNNSEYILTNDEIAVILYQYKNEPASVRIYKTVITCLTNMKALYAQNGFRSRDRELSTEVEEYGKERYDSICSLLTYYKNHPQDIITEGYSMSPIIIGGVNKSTYTATRNNPNTLNGLANLDPSRVARASTKDFYES